jgi:hypothetical protein
LIQQQWKLASCLWGRRGPFTLYNLSGPLLLFTALWGLLSWVLGSQKLTGWLLWPGNSLLDCFRGVSETHISGVTVSLTKVHWEWWNWVVPVQEFHSCL